MPSSPVGKSERTRNAVYIRPDEQQEAGSRRRVVMLVQLWLLLFSAMTDNVRSETDSSDIADMEASMRSPNRLFPSLILSAPMSRDDACARHSRHLEAAIANYTLWAMTMLESSVRGESVAVLSGSTRQLGDYDQCLAAEAPFGSQFCLATVKYKMPAADSGVRAQADHHQHYDPYVKVWDKLYFTGREYHYPLDEVVWGLCVPSTCNATEMEKALKRHLFTGPGSRETPARVISVHVTACSAEERIQEAYKLDILDYSFIAISVALFSVVAAATLLDMLGYIDKGNRGVQLLQCFSSKRNLNAMARKDPAVDGIRVEYLSGMRFLTITFLVAVHRVLHTYRGPVHNYLYVADAVEKVRLTGVIHGQTFVDTCFFLAGFFLAFIHLSRPKRVPFHRALLLRYIRLTPPYAIMILFYASLYYKLGSGPLWDDYMAVERDACRSNWWANLLYINNYVPTDALCMFHSWSLAADMHYFIVGTLLLALLRKNARVGYTVLGVSLFLSLLVPFALTAYNHWPPMLMFYPSFMKDIHHSEVFRLMYSASHNRAAPYVVGLIAGAVLHRYKHTTFKLGVIGTWSSEIVAWTIGLPCLFTSVIFYDPSHEYNWLESAFYASLVPFGWALSLLTCTLGALFGVTTASRTFLQFKPFVILSRLTYCVYLVHWSFQTSYTANLRAPYHTTEAKTVFEALGDIMNAYLSAFVLYIVVEAPSRQLARVFIRSESDSKKSKKESARNGYVLSAATDADVNSNHKPSANKA